MIRSLALVATLLVASRADAVPRNTVKAHVDKAMKAHKEGKFDVALDELKAAYALDPKPDLLFAIAQVYVKLENCGEAISYYEKFLATQKDVQTRQVVMQAIDTCKTKLAGQPKVEPKVEPKVDPEPKVEPKPEPKLEPKPEPKLEPKPDPRREDDPFAKGRSDRAREPSPWYKDPIGDALVGGGVLAGVGGFLMWRGASSDIDKANASTDIAQFRDFEDRAKSKRTFSVVLAGASVALVTVGIVRYRSHAKKERARVGLVPSTDGGLVTMSGRF